MRLVYGGKVPLKSIVRGTLGGGEEGVVRISFVHCINYLDQLISDNRMENVKLIMDHLKA
jgi:hypothetical protein